MMESAYFGECEHLSQAAFMHPPRVGCILREGEMGSRPVVVPAVAHEDPVQMSLAQNDDVVEALAA
jgi:hypothetical protein